MHFLPNKLALACAIALSLAACNDNSSNAPADPAATKASLMQTMDEALREGQALDPYGFAIDAASIAKRKALDSSLLKRLDALDSSVLSERDRLFYDMIRWDLQINLAGYDLPQSQIPIHHFRNRVVDLADEVGLRPPVAGPPAPSSAASTTSSRARPSGLRRGCRLAARYRSPGRSPGSGEQGEGRYRATGLVSGAPHLAQGL